MKKSWNYNPDEPSVFGKAFSREMGKNTGKFISNLIFGDMHSTPYRRVSGKARMAVANAKAQQINAIATAKVEHLNKQDIFAIDRAVLENIDAVAQIRTPNNREELVSLLQELATQLSANHWGDFQEEEAKVRNKFSNALFEKYKQGLRILKMIAPDELLLEYFEEVREKTAKRKFWGKYQGIVIACLGLLFLIILCLIGVLYENGKLANFGYNVLGITIAIVAIILTVKVIKKKKKKAKQLQQQSKLVKQTTSTVSPNFQPSEVINTSIFIDLNEHNRIENRLSSIWERYRNHVDKQIISRKPIFSADGIKDSILFVGVNPSFNPNDDKIFVHSSDDKTLLYGSLYQLPDAPNYFKHLENFAAQVGTGYSHINLLYARENDRDLLLRCDHNFIREQLELTYETILRIKPKAIIFFTDYCKDLIFGADRWVIPDSETSGHHVLKGTNHPVIFTDDITTLSMAEQDKLINALKQII